MNNSSSQEQGDFYENYFQQYMEKKHAAGKIRFIQADDTKYDKSHGIDKAYVIGDYQFLCIAEVKSPYSSLNISTKSVKQMSKDGILRWLDKLKEKNPQHELLTAMKKVLASGGTVYSCTYRVNPNSVNKPPVYFTKGGESTSASDIFTENELAGVLDKTILSTFSTNLKSGGFMANTDSYANQLRMLEELKITLGNLNRYLYEIEQRYKQQINYAESGGFMQENIVQLRQKQQRFSIHIEKLSDCIASHRIKIDEQKEDINDLRRRSMQSQ